MTQEEILQGNKLIAEFLSVAQFQNQPLNYYDALQYHCSWDWLLPVIIEIGNKTGYELVMHTSFCYWNNGGDNPLTEYGGYDDIANIFKAVTDFITWYNQNKQN